MMNESEAVYMEYDTGSRPNFLLFTFYQLPCTIYQLPTFPLCKCVARKMLSRYLGTRFLNSFGLTAACRCRGLVSSIMYSANSWGRGDSPFPGQTLQKTVEAASLCREGGVRLGRKESGLAKLLM